MLVNVLTYKLIVPNDMRHIINHLFQFFDKIDIKSKSYNIKDILLNKDLYYGRGESR